MNEQYMMTLEDLKRAAVSTREIVEDHTYARRFGHNPSWVKIADAEQAMNHQKQVAETHLVALREIAMGRTEAFGINAQEYARSYLAIVSKS